MASILDGTEAGVMAGILADPEQRSRHVDTIAAFAADGDFAGIDIDYEQFAFADGRDTWAATRPNWVAFVEELAARLHDDGRILTVSIPPVYDAGQTPDSGFWVYDYAAITPHVDAIRVMAYDYSVPAGDPGPIAPLAVGRPGDRRHDRRVRRPVEARARRAAVRLQLARGHHRHVPATAPRA